MAAPASQTRTVNRALALLGSTARVLSIGDGTPAAACATALWDDAIAAVLVAHPWSFAKARAALSADTVGPAFGYAFSYTLPTDCLRWLPAAPTDEAWFAGEVENGRILTDQTAPLYIRYIRRNTDLSTWTAGAIDALTARLAWEMAEPITGGLEGVADRMLAKYQTMLDTAKTSNALESGDRAGRVEDGSAWLQARNGLAPLGSAPWRCP